jgi:tetratricopeptide (TPR) repeat protein
LYRGLVDKDPLNANLLLNLGVALLGDGRYAEAKVWLKRTLELSPHMSLARGSLGWAELLSGDAQEALANFKKASDDVGTVAALEALGRHQESKDALERLERDDPEDLFWIACGRASRKDVDGAFEALHAAVPRQQVLLRYFAKVTPALLPLHADPRWKAFLAEMNLPVD